MPLSLAVLEVHRKTLVEGIRHNQLDTISATLAAHHYGVKGG